MLADLQVGTVGCQSASQSGCNPGGDITAHGRGSEENDAGVVRLDRADNCLGIWDRREMIEALIIYIVDSLAAVMA